MKIIEVKGVEKSKNPHGVDVRKLYDTENAQVMLISLKPGEAL